MNSSAKLMQQIISLGLALLFLTKCGAPTPAFTPPTSTPTHIPTQSQLPTIAPTSTAPPDQVAPNTEAWVYFVSEPGRFEVRIPATQSISDEVVRKTTLGKPADCHVLFARDNGAFWLVQYCDYPPELVAKLTTKEILGKARDEALEDAAAIPGTVTEENVYFNSHPGRAIVADSALKGDGGRGTYKVRVYLVSNRLYRVATYVFEENWGNRMSTMDPFLDSFYIDDN